jgi:hypothetical protein
MKARKYLVKHSRLLLIASVASLCVSGCAAPLVALGTSAAGAGMQALGGATGAAALELVGDRVGEAVQNYTRGGEQLADVTYWARPALLKNVVNQTLQDAVSSSFVALQYTRSDQKNAGLFVLLTSTGSEMRIAVQQDSSFDEIQATQMVVDMETAEVASQETEISAFIKALQEIDDETQRRGIEKIRGDFNYAAGFDA